MTPYKLRLVVEWLLLFFAVPLAISQKWLPLPGPFFKLLILLLAMVICLIYLLWDKKFDNRRLGGLKQIQLVWKVFTLRVLLCALLLLALCWLFFPQTLFGFVAVRPTQWLVVLICYPFLSAWPQELIYRAFMFQRYQELFGNNITMIVASAAAFAFLHIIYLNWIAIVMTLVAGFIFAANYKKIGFLTPVALEHAIYGNLVFTIGLGMFFFRSI